MKRKKWVCAVIALMMAALLGVIPASAKTAVKDMLPSKEWSSEGTLNPVKTQEGWKLKTSPTMDGGSAVCYFDHTYHKGQMIAYDFTVVGDEDANITIYIGFLRDLEASVYPNGKEGYHFTKYLAESIGIEATGAEGEEKATIPGGTYKGVLDLGDFFYDGFDKFQHVAFYVGGEEMIIREFAFVEGAQAGAETFPKPVEKKPVESAPAAPAPAAPDETPASDGNKVESDDKTAAAPEEKADESRPANYTAILIVLSAVSAVSLAAVAVMAVLLVKKKKQQ